VELRQLRYFVAVAQELHFRRAAERLHVARPAVCAQVGKLETELGVQLFERTHRSVSLTDAGVAFLEEARRVLRQAEVARQAAHGAADRAVMRLRIGYLQDALPSAVPRALRQVVTSLPAVQLDLHSGPALGLVDDVRAGRLDAAITSLPAPTNGLRTLHLGEERAVVALPAMHPHAVEAEIAIARLAPQRIVVLPQEANPAFRNAVAAMCHAEGLAPTFIEVAEARVEQALLAVAGGAGPAILPESVTERYATPGVRLVPLADRRAAFQIVLLTRPDDASLATGAFVRALQRTTGTRKAAPSCGLVADSGGAVHAR
jgi:DNA-binding transcriptional LysR family regulator